MDIERTTLPGVRLIRPAPIRDERGFFVRVLSAPEYVEAGIPVGQFVQENQSRSRRSTLRGLHFRAPGEGKTVRCARGEIFYVTVDVRPRSATFGQWESFTLDDRDHLQVYVPPGVANGFQAISEEVDVCYRHDQPYVAGYDRGMAWNDPALAVPWPISDPVLSEKDRNAVPLAELTTELETWFPTAPSA